MEEDQNVSSQGEETGISQVENIDIESLRSEIKKVRSEAASYRVKLKNLQEQKTNEINNSLSESEQLKIKVETLSNDLKSTKESLRIQEIKNESISIGIIDPDIVPLLIKQEEGESLKDAISRLVESKPYLKSQVDVKEKNIAPSIQATQPGNNSKNGVITQSQLRDTQWVISHKDDISRAAKEGRIRYGV